MDSICHYSHVSDVAPIIAKRVHSVSALSFPTGTGEAKRF